MRRKQILSWLLALVMVISLIPVNPVRAEGWDTYNVYLNPSISTDWYMEEYQAGFTISVAENQEGVTDNGDDSYDVEAGRSFTVIVEAPAKCNVDYLKLLSDEEVIADFTAVEGQENTYQVSIVVDDNLALSVEDSTYSRLTVEGAVTNFDCTVEVEDGIESGIEWYVRKGTGYTLYFSDLSEDEISTLDITINGETVDKTNVVANDTEQGDYKYTVSNVTKDQEVRVHETGTMLTVMMPDLSIYGYEIYDANGENKIGYASVEKGASLTFQVKEMADAETIEFGLYVNDEELIPEVDENGVRTYTISSVTWNNSVYDYMKYLVSISGVNMIPCTEDGENLTEDGVSGYYYRSNSLAYFKLDADLMEYEIKHGDTRISPVENGVYCVTVEDESVTLIATKYYHVTVSEGDTYGVSAGTDDFTYEKALDENDYLLYYCTTDTFIFDVVVEEDYTGEDMVVTIQYEDGKVETLTKTGESVEDDCGMVYSFETEALTQNAHIQIKGVYATIASVLGLYYDESAMADLGLEIKVLDADEEELRIDDEYTDKFYYRVHNGLEYTLVISGITENAPNLNDLKVKADEEDLIGTISDGVWKADITSVNTVIIAYGNQFYVNYVNSGDVDGIYVTEYGQEYTENMRGYYPAGNLSFWIDEDYETVTADNAYVVSIKDGNGNAVAYTKQDNVEVDQYGTKRTVYTVNLQSDITIEIAGADYVRYSVYLPIPDETAGYTISDLYTVSFEWDDDLEEAVMISTNLTGVKDAANGCTKYTSIAAESEVYFDITLDKTKGVPYVVMVSGKQLYPNLSKELDASMMQYTFSFSVQESADISISANTQAVTVEAITTGDTQYYVTFDGWDNSWNIYDEATRDDDDQEAIVTICDLPAIINKNDTGHQYNIQFLTDWSFMVDDDNLDLFLTAKQEDGTTKALSMFHESGDSLTEYYNMPIQDGYYTLLVDMDKLESRKGKVTLVSHRDDMTINVEGTEGTDYSVVAGKENTYKALNQTLTFSVTAEDAADFESEDFFLGMSGYTWDGTYETSEDGKTRTYTITEVCSDGCIRVSYPATVAFEEVENGNIYTNAIGEGGGWDENDNFYPGTFAADAQVGLNFSVTIGYDVESVKVVHKYVDVDGEEQITYYTDFEDYAWQNDRLCVVTLQPGVNTFSLTQPQKKTYTMNMPSGVAYTIELVNGSSTKVLYNESFSFKVNENVGYDLSEISVTANGQKMTPDANGIYTIKNVHEDYDIGVTGFKTNKHLVTFKNYDGTVLKTETVEHGKTATAPAEPTRDCYTFTGWDTTFTSVTKDITVTATYKPILVSKLEIAGDYKNLAVGKTVQLSATAIPVNALNADVVWTTSNPKHATVSATGKVKALEKGAGKMVTITATAKDGSGVKATYKIKIYKNAIKKIKLSAKSKSVKAGKKLTIKAELTPNKSVFKTLKWTSSNEKWATVNAKGVVTTKKAGKGKTVKITAWAMDGSGKKATFTIKIKK